VYPVLPDSDCNGEKNEKSSHVGRSPIENSLLCTNDNYDRLTAKSTAQRRTEITGAFVGTVRDRSGNVIMIDQLWGIDFGDGVPNTNNGPANELFFTAGPDNNVDGTFGSIVFK
jgi:hypothetical protein